jgi:hypothetical protein
LVSSFPDSPADGGYTNGMKFFTSWKPSVAPEPTLAEGARYIVGTNAFSNYPPHSLGCATLKKEMSNCFFLGTKIACWASYPLPSQQIIFCLLSTTYGI